MPQDSYFISDIIGLSVFTTSNDYLGIVEDIFPTGSNDVYVVKKKDRKADFVTSYKRCNKRNKFK